MSDGTATPRALDLQQPAPPPASLRRRLDLQGERLIEGLRAPVRRHLRRACEIELAPATSLRGRQFRSSGAASVWSASRTDDGGAGVLLETPVSLVASIVDRCLGGSGEVEAGERAPSELERELGSAFVLDLHASLIEVLAAPPLQLRTVEPRLLQEPPETYLPDPHAVFVQLEAEVRTPVGRHVLRLAWPIPAEDAEEETPPAAEALSQGWAAGQELELRVELARCRLPLESLRELEVGDVVLFEAQPGDPVRLVVDGKEQARGRWGVAQGRNAVEVRELRSTGAADV